MLGAFDQRGGERAGGVVTVDEKRGVILAVHADPTQAEGPITDLGDVILLPALVNAHTHCELSDIREPLGRPGMPFVDWIREVIAWKEANLATPQARQNAIRRGWLEVKRGGAARVCDVVSALRYGDLPVYDDPLLHAESHLELMGHALGWAEDALLKAREFVGRPQASRRVAAGRRSGWQAGLSPHAPYTASLELVASIADVSRKAACPVSIHLAESEEELELLATGGGPFRELLLERGIYRKEHFPGGRTPLDYLEALRPAAAVSVIHGTFLSDAEIDFIARQPNFRLVYCPRTHAYFHDRSWPLARRLARCGSVLIGTDSRASNPDLSIFDELKFVSATAPDVSPRDLIAGSLSASAASSAGNRLNDWLVIEAPTDVADPYEAALHVRATLKGFLYEWRSRDA